MNRSESLEMWRGIAAGSLEDSQYNPIDPLPWIRGVAKKIVAADKVQNPGARLAALSVAMGLSGKHDKYAELRSLIEECTMFSPLDDDGNEIPQTRSQEVSFIVEEGIRRGLLVGIYADDDKKAKELVRKLLTKQI